MGSNLARGLWQLIETIHAVVYFEPEAKAIYGRAGLKGYWMGYFASRSAAFGTAPAEVVIATFHNFHPAMVRRAIPDAWSFSTPQKVLEARYEVATKALADHLEPSVSVEQIATAAELARRAAEACDPAGRSLFAAHASLDWPAAPTLELWHACTLLREFRGDGHVACLTASGIDGCEAHVLFAASEGIDRSVYLASRGWSDQDWSAAMGRLQDRGLMEGDVLTERGRALRARIESDTDRASLSGWEALGDDVDRFVDAITPAVLAIVESGAVPFPNPVGLPRPSLS